jgi:hypothetical protein
MKESSPIFASLEQGYVIQVAGVFEGDNDNVWADTPYGRLVIGREFIGPFMLFLDDAFDLSTLADRPEILLVNNG